MDNLEIKKYINMAIKRKWYIIIPFLVTILCGFTYLLKAPKIYEAETLILVMEQKVPESYVRDVVTTGLTEMLTTISQQVTSRTNLENIIQRFGLYGSLGGDDLLAQKVEIMRGRISINVATGRQRYTNAFSISFRSEDPTKAMDVTNLLADNFISQNITIREEVATGTSTFLSEEVKNIEKRLEKKEAELKEYNERYMGGLPDELSTNLSTLTRLQTKLAQLNDNLRDAKNRKLTILKDIAASKESKDEKEEGYERQNEIDSLKDELILLESKYTENHPDIISLRNTIEKLEKEELRIISQNSSDVDEEYIYTENSAILNLERQLDEIEYDIKNYEEGINDTNASINRYQALVDATPKREQELLILERDYNNLVDSYRSLLDRQLESEISVNMEKKQKGEQFHIIDPAKIPTIPVEPDVRKIAMMTLFLGLGLGFGIAYLIDMMDTSYRSPDDVEKGIQLPIMTTIPVILTNKESGIIKTKKIIAYASVSIGFILSVIGILVTVKGVPDTIDFVKGFFLIV